MRRYLFKAIDRATRRVPTESTRRRRRPTGAPSCATRPYRPDEPNVLTGNGKHFTDRLFGPAAARHRSARPRSPCARLGIKRRLAPPMRPRTNGLVESFLGRLPDGCLDEPQFSNLRHGRDPITALTRRRNPSPFA
jgi:transposase InsO family protein